VISYSFTAMRRTRFCAQRPAPFSSLFLPGRRARKHARVPAETCYASAFLAAPLRCKFKNSSVNDHACFAATLL
jgi:hypothetical protein